MIETKEMTEKRELSKKELHKEMYFRAGKRIQVARTKRGFRREHLAERAGVSTKYLYEIENGRTGFSTHVLYDIAKALDVGCDYILFGDEKNGCDEMAIETLKLFNEEQGERIAVILKKIHELL